MPNNSLVLKSKNKISFNWRGFWSKLDQWISTTFQQLWIGNLTWRSLLGSVVESSSSLGIGNYHVILLVFSYVIYMWILCYFALLEIDYLLLGIRFILSVYFSFVRSLIFVNTISCKTKYEKHLKNETNNTLVLLLKYLVEYTWKKEERDLFSYK